MTQDDDILLFDKLTRKQRINYYRQHILENIRFSYLHSASVPQGQQKVTFGETSIKQIKNKENRRTAVIDGSLLQY
jgi:hypothetical protein